MPSKNLRGESAYKAFARPTTAASAAATATNAHLAAAFPLHPRMSAQADPTTTAAPGDPPPSLLLGPLLGTLPADLLQQEVLRRLGPTDLASLAGAGRGCAAAVAATALMVWARRAKLTAPWHLGYYLPPLCLKEACSHAARCGNRLALEWLHNTGCPWDARTACAAARGGHLEVVTWLHTNDCPWGFMPCAHAAAGGHLEVLQWTHEHHCPWDSFTPAWAAEGGHLAVLQWAMQHVCPWNKHTTVCAAGAGQLEVLQWVWENDTTGAAWDEMYVRVYADGPKKQEVLTWMDPLGAP